MVQPANPHRPTPRKTVFPSEAIIAELRGRISSGQWKPGEAIPAETVLAAQFGVCRATMNKTLKTLEREGLVWGGPGRGRFVSDRPMRRRTGVIEVVVSDTHTLTQPAFVRLVDAMSHRISASGYHFRLVQLNRFDYPELDRCLDVVKPEQIDGCIIHTQAIRLDAAQALAARVPTVWFHHATQGPALAGVRYDWIGGAFAAIRHLLEYGHRELALMTVNERFVAGAEQVAGAKLATKNLGQGANLQVATAVEYSEAEGERLTRELLERQPRMTGLVLGSDDFAPGVFAALAKAGVRVPQDLSVVSWNDTLRPDQSPVPVTSLRMDFQRAGVAGAESLLSMIEKPGEAVPTVEIEAELLVRESTALLPAR